MINKLPRHVSIIMDGNGRWAKRRGLDRLQGHRAGVDSVRAAAEFAAENRIEFLSLFAFSEENWNRPQDEIEGLMELMIDAIIGERETLMNNNIIFKVIGDFSRLSQRLLDKIADIQNTTSINSGLTLIVFLSYSGKWDIINAFNMYLKDLREGIESIDCCFDSQKIERYLSTHTIPDPDLLIRTSGEQRISNYMLWQCAYTEFYFTEVLWPDFRKNDFKLALDTYMERERRYGKTGEQINKIN
jgi:undecaprenyl diphosphate synthase